MAELNRWLSCYWLCMCVCVRALSALKHIQQVKKIKTKRRTYKDSSTRSSFCYILLFSVHWFVERVLSSPKHLKEQ